MSDSPFMPPARREHGSVARPRQAHAVEVAQQSSPDASFLLPLVQMAKDLDRDETRMLDAARHIGMLLGESGFYSFRMGGKAVEGPTIVMAEALASEWGGLVHQVEIVSAQPMSSGGQRVHLRARVIDLCRIVVGSADSVISTAPPPGRFAEKLDQAERWHGMQIQSAASKIKRNAIFDVLPGWFVSEAVGAAKHVANDMALRVKNADGQWVQVSLGEKIDRVLNSYFQEWGLTPNDLAAWVGHDVRLWTVVEINGLTALWRELKEGTATSDTVREAGKPEKVSPDQGARPVPEALRTEPAALPEPVPNFQQGQPEAREKVAAQPTSSSTRQQDDAPPPHGESQQEAPTPEVEPRFTDESEARAYIDDANAKLGTSIEMAIRTKVGVSVTMKPSDGRLGAPKALAWANALHAAEQELLAEASGGAE